MYKNHRNATQDQITELKLALKAKHLSPYHKRIQEVYLGSQKLTYKAISDLIGLSHDSIWRLVKKYEQDGLSALIHLLVVFQVNLSSLQKCMKLIKPKLGNKRCEKGFMHC